MFRRETSGIVLKMLLIYFCVAIKFVIVLQNCKSTTEIVHNKNKLTNCNNIHLRVDCIIPDFTF